MGRLAAEDMVEQGIDRRLALRWHLTSNHFPPLPIELLPVAERVIDKAEAGKYHARVRLPEGITWRGKKLAPVWAAAEAWHLDAFIHGSDYLEEDWD